MATLSPAIVLCPGQGAQAVAMGKAWFEASPEARDVFERADRILGSRLGAPLSSLCFDGPSTTLDRTDVSQPALFVTGVASWHAIRARWGVGAGEEPLAACAGLSLGEYTALHVAGVLGFEDALELVALRGRAMQDAAESGPASGMLALIGADEAKANAIVEEARAGEVLVCANFNAPGQIVLSGHASAIGRASESASRLGLRAVALSVAGAFHSPIMAPAAARLREALSRVALAPSRCPVLSNATGLPHTMGESVRTRLVDQLTSPVRWQECVAWIARHAVGQTHELAPGRTLMGLARKIDRNLKVNSHDLPTD